MNTSTPATTIKAGTYVTLPAQNQDAHEGTYVSTPSTSTVRGSYIDGAAARTTPASTGRYTAADHGVAGSRLSARRRSTTSLPAQA